jgi:hypothetical protein
MHRAACKGGNFMTIDKTCSDRKKYRIYEVATAQVADASVRVIGKLLITVTGSDRADTVIAFLSMMGRNAIKKAL